MYLETMQDIIPNVKHVYVMDNKEQAVLPLLNLTDNGQARSADSSTEQLRSPLNTSRMQ